MAIDTAAKRRSALRKTLLIPDGTIDAADRQHVTWNYSGILAEDVQVLIPLRRFRARKRQFQFVAIGEYAVQAFAKLPTETYHLAIDFATRLPLSTYLVSGMLAAIDEATGVDATADVLASPTATIQDTDAILTPEAGTAGHDYLLTLSATLNTGAVLVEQLRMQVRSKL